jgi:glutamate dehydrogenase/leucine dehydrogenase
MADTFKEALARLNAVKKYFPLEEKILKVLIEPEKVLEAELKITLDSGEQKTFKAFRVQHNSVLGPTKGGIRFHPQVTLEEVKALAFWMTWKSAILGLPYGGGKGGVICNPKELSKKELEKISRAYVKAFFKDLGPDIDIPAPDVYTDAQTMAWMSDEYNKLAGKKVPGAFTGKPIELGGSRGREQATAQGGVYVLEEIRRKLGMKAEKMTVAIQGYGNAGSFVAKLLHVLNYKIVAVSDSKGGIYSKHGLEPVEVLEHKKKTRSVIDFPGSEKITNEQLLESEVDILIPAALEDQITGKNAAKIKAKIILELANGPVTPEADQILDRNQVLVIPDIVANAGGVTVSYFEWVQNRMGCYWEEKEVLERLQKKMVQAMNRIWEAKERYKVDLRTAAYIVGLESLVKALKYQGAI